MKVRERGLGEAGAVCGCSTCSATLDYGHGELRGQALVMRMESLRTLAGRLPRVLPHGFRTLWGPSLSKGALCSR